MPINVKIGADTSAFKTGLAEIENRTTAFANHLGGILLGAFGFEAIREGFANAIEKGAKIGDLAKRFDISANALQQIGNAAELSGSSMEAVASAMGKLAKNAGEALGGNTQLQDSFKQIGVSMQDLQTMTPQDLFYALSKAVNSGSLGMQDFAVVTQLAGKSAGELMETLRSGPDAIMANGAAMGVWSDETVAALKAADDALKTLQNNFTIFFGNLAIGINSAVQRYQDLVEAIYLHIRANRDEQLDAAGRASLYEQSAAKVGDVVFGRSKIQQPTEAEPMRRRGLSDDESITRAQVSAAKDLERAQERLSQAIRDRETLEMDGVQKIARAQAELVSLQAEINALQANGIDQINKKADAEKKAAEVMQLQADYARDAARATEEQARAQDQVSKLGEDLASLTAQRQGPKAEMALQEKRVIAADKQAQESGTLEDAVTRQKEALRLQQMKEARFSQLGYDENTARQMANRQVSGMMGPDPKFSMLSDIGRSTVQTQKVVLDKVPGLDEVVEKLQTLIRTAGEFK